MAQAQSQQQQQQQQGPLGRAHSTRSLAAPLTGAALSEVRYKQAVHTDQLRSTVERERRAEEEATSPTRTGTHSYIIPVYLYITVTLL